MTTIIKLDVFNRIVLSRDLRRAAGLSAQQKLRVLATPGRIVLEVEPNEGKVIQRGKLKVWTGKVPSAIAKGDVFVSRKVARGWLVSWAVRWQ